MHLEDNNDPMIHHLINSMPMDVYDGRSSNEMEYLVNEPYCENSPLVLLKDYDKEILKNVPFFCLVKQLLLIIHESNGIKLTAQGNLPTKMVKDLYLLKFIEEPWLEEKADKTIKEFDSVAISAAKIITELAGFTKKKTNELVLSKKASQLIKGKDDITLFHEILKTYTMKFAWSYNDYYGENEIGQIGFAFSLDLLDKYGTISRNPSFYTEKYKEALNEVFIEQEAMGKSIYDLSFENCYIFRTFDTFFKWFGLVFITIENVHHTNEYRVEKSNIFNLLLKFD